MMRPSDMPGREKRATLFLREAGRVGDAAGEVWVRRDAGFAYRRGDADPGLPR